MSLETGVNYITDLIYDGTNYPSAGDGLDEARNHIQIIKKSLLGTFSSFAGAAVTVTEAQLNALPGTVATNSADIGVLEGASGANHKLNYNALVSAKVTRLTSPGACTVSGSSGVTVSRTATSAEYEITLPAPFNGNTDWAASFAAHVFSSSYSNVVTVTGISSSAPHITVRLTNVSVGFLDFDFDLIAHYHG